jgi:hypothetical protein
MRQQARTAVNAGVTPLIRSATLEGSSRNAPSPEWASSFVPSGR